MAYPTFATQCGADGELFLAAFGPGQEQIACIQGRHEQEKRD